MTESDWLSCADATTMLDFLLTSSTASERKLRLFAVACCRRILKKVRSRQRDNHVMTVAERYADGEAEASELAEAYASLAFHQDDNVALACAEAADPEGGLQAVTRVVSLAATSAREHAASLAHPSKRWEAFDAGGAAELVAQVALLRDIFGPSPISQVRIGPAWWLSWSDSTLVNLAQAIYEERTFPGGFFNNSRLAILSDALIDAGCDDEEILNHLRQPNAIHVRGCWVVDLLLGKS